MFKRVLLLLLLVAVLVVPGAAEMQSYTWSPSPDEDWSAGMISSGGVIVRSSNTGVSAATLTLPYDLVGDFEATVHFSQTQPDSSRRGAFGIQLNSRSGMMLSCHHDMGGYYPDGDVVVFPPSWKAEYVSSTKWPSYNGDMTLSRVGNTLRVYFDNTLLYTYPSMPTDDLHNVVVHFDTRSGYTAPTNQAVYSVTLSGVADLPVPDQFYPCTINVYDADSRLPLSGSWDYYVAVNGGDPVSGSGSGAFKAVYLPATSILQPHLLSVTKEGYEQTAPLAFDVPVGGREVNVYLTPLETTAPEGSSVVTFSVTDIETGTPRNQCLVNVDGVAKYTGASGTAWFVLPDNTTHQWIVTAEGYWPIGGNFTLGVDDLAISVGMTKKSSDLPRPPFPGIPCLPVIHPSLDPSGFRMQILNVPILGGLAESLLDSIDAIGLGVNDIALSILDVLRYPADYIVNSVVDVGSGLVETSSAYLSTSGLLLQVIGSIIHCIPSEVCGLVTFGLLLDIVRILLWGPI